MLHLCFSNFIAVSAITLIYLFLLKKESEQNIMPQKVPSPADFKYC